MKSINNRSYSNDFLTEDWDKISCEDMIESPSSINKVNSSLCFDNCLVKNKGKVTNRRLLVSQFRNSGKLFALLYQL